MEFKIVEGLPEVVCVILDNGSEILVEERLDKDDLFGHITFLGGRVDDIDRTSNDYYINSASSREIEEETGIQLDPKQFRTFTCFEAVSKTNYHANYWGTYARYVDRDHNEEKEEGKRRLHWMPYEEVGKRVKGNPVDDLIWQGYLRFLSVQKVEKGVG